MLPKLLPHGAQREPRTCLSRAERVAGAASCSGSAALCAGQVLEPSLLSWCKRCRLLRDQGCPWGGPEPTGVLPAAGKRLCARLLLAPVMTSPEEALSAQGSLQGLLLLLLLLITPSCFGPSTTLWSGRFGWYRLPWHLQESNQPSKWHKPPVPKGAEGTEQAGADRTQGGTGCGAVNRRPQWREELGVSSCYTSRDPCACSPCPGLHWFHPSTGIARAQTSLGWCHCADGDLLARPHSS